MKDGNGYNESMETTIQVCGMVDIILVCVSHTYHSPKIVHLPTFMELLLSRLHPSIYLTDAQ